MVIFGNTPRDCFVQIVTGHPRSWGEEGGPDRKKGVSEKIPSMHYVCTASHFIGFARIHNNNNVYTCVGIMVCRI